MAWVFAAVVVIFLAIRFVWARVLLGVSAVLFGCVLVWVFAQDAARHRADEASKGKIQPSEVTFEDARLGTDYGSSRLTARLTNHSARYLLTGGELVITAQDCSPDPPSCQIIGQDTVDFSSSIPPGQTRAQDQYVYFSGMPTPRGQFHWYYVIKYFKGQ